VKILFIDKDSELENLFHYLNNTKNFDVTFAKELTEIKPLYKKEEIDIVIIDFDMDNGKEILEFVLKQNEKQRIITISEKWYCSDKILGIQCQKDSNKRRLIKPVNIDDLSEYLQNFDSSVCFFKNKFNSPENLVEIMDHLLSGYPFVKYCNETKLIRFKKPNREMLEILEKLLSSGIKFELLDDTVVKLVSQK